MNAPNVAPLPPRISRRATVVVNTADLSPLLEDDRRSAGELAHIWFREEPSEGAMDDYTDVSTRSADVAWTLGAVAALASFLVAGLLLY